MVNAQAKKKEETGWDLDFNLTDTIRTLNRKYHRNPKTSIEALTIKECIYLLITQALAEKYAVESGNKSYIEFKGSTTVYVDGDYRLYV